MFEPLTQRLSHANPWLAMPIIILPAYLMFLAVQWPAAGHHLYGYISFNSQFVEPGATIASRHISDTYGYDGQFYFRLALDPVSDAERVHGIRFDSPPLRQQRILLPTLTWILARGDPERSAVVMLVLNLLAVTGCALAGGALLKHHGLTPWPALLLAFYPGFAVSVERFLTEPLSMALVLSSLLLLARDRTAWAGVLLALAVLARETALLVAVIMGVAWLARMIFRNSRHFRTAPGPATWLPALLVYVAWQAWLHAAWSRTALSTGGPNDLGWPLHGIASSVWQLLSQPDAMQLFFLLMLVSVVAWSVVVARSCRATAAPYPWLWLVYLALAIVLGTAAWDNSPGFLRITTELNLLGLLVYLLGSRTIPRWLVWSWMSAWLLTAGAEAYRLQLVAGTRDAQPVPALSATPIPSSRLANPG